MNVHIDKNSKTPYYWQIVIQVKQLILSGVLQDGAVVPSERQMSQLLGVHRNTVIRAYGELKSEGFLVSRQGVGYQVSYSAKSLSKLDEPFSIDEKPYAKAVNWEQMIKPEYRDVADDFDSVFQRSGAIDSPNSFISMAVGMPPLIYDDQEIAQDIAQIIRESGRRRRYIAPYQGDEECRRQIMNYVRTKGIKSTLGQIQLMSETNQAFDFIITATTRPGDKIIVEEPVSPDVYRLIALNDCIAITVPMDENGMVCDNLEGLIEKHKPKYIYVNSSYHDPTGTVLSLERRKKLLSLSTEYRIPIIEDDAASDLPFYGDYIPSIKSMDRYDNVIYIYSFALSFIPGMSMAFIIGSEELIRSLRYMVSIRLMSLEWMAQKLIAKCLEDGRYRRKTGEIRRRNRENFRVLCPYLDQLADWGVSYIKPKGGVYVWVSLPPKMDSGVLVKEASQRGLALIAGSTFYPDKRGGENKLRINFSHESAERIRRGMKLFCDLVRQENIRT